METRKLMVVGTHSNTGKTTVTLGLMAAYKNLGYTVQGFKSGPDYIDPTYQTILTGRKSRNLDSWMCDESKLKEIFSQGCQGADIAIIEGVMGMFDGKDPLSDVGSSAEIAKITDTPVLLVIDASGVARSAAAIVKGFQTLSPEVEMCGVVANFVGSEGHYELIKQAVEAECDVPVIGYLEQDDRLTLPERYAGLVPLLKSNDHPIFPALAENVQQSIDLKMLYEKMAKETTSDHPNDLFGIEQQPQIVQIAVAHDEAFHFYYEENLELLEQSGAELVYFSPLKGDKLPEDVHGLYIGGGFPEQFADKLSKQTATKTSIVDKVMNGLPTLAEGGGLMYLSELITTVDGEEYDMLGIIPGKVMVHDQFVDIAYRVVSGAVHNFLLKSDEIARGHEFHFSSFEESNVSNYAYEVTEHQEKQPDGINLKNVVASYIHLHFVSSPQIAKRWVDACEAYKRNNS